MDRKFRQFLRISREMIIVGRFYRLYSVQRQQTCFELAHNQGHGGWAQRALRKECRRTQAPRAAAPSKPGFWLAGTQRSGARLFYGEL